MILTGKQIIKSVQDGHIDIRPFDRDAINPNSVNYRLGESIAEVDFSIPLDPAGEPSIQPVRIPENGMVLRPDRHYLSATFEKIGSTKFVPSLIGRSSLGRLGLFLQISADLGNLGACHCWTLELRCARPIKIYPRMRIGQVSFWVPTGPADLYSGYLGQFDQPALPIPRGFDL